MTTSETTMKSPIFPTWCPGCGDYGIWSAIKKALAESNIPEEQLVVVYGVGCSGNMADFIRCYGFHALHGRALPVAEAIKLANHKLKVLVVAGDGDTYGEGMGHFISACRGNHDITLLVHDNQVYGLTTGQAAPTTEHGRRTKTTPFGVIEMPVNPVGLALTSDATFIARGYAGNIPYTAELIKKAINHKGFSLVDVFQPCVTFNKVNTHLWYQERVYQLETVNHDTHNKEKAWNLTFEHEKLPIGVFYEDTSEPSYSDSVSLLKEKALTEYPIDNVNLGDVFKKFV
ncbi:2-oxoacid ferredoxin oxidoreductase [Candidatus Cerribacteria bacterium 'Amazon FNV 2010 28 9']|uniref:2-oxoacid ferredoxin oxidoreductase n=1 Tax=Candidatus Cerribacteria bacterium 'Amazon FNV 2010 28 9' TaxID=2081795 RepID=A0A317JRT9_9BACT|nr:MAG: 2-oxoacid ferredoxin oxidoreductase [Candidatus Cerribacteria bacterium 'Amazon FNV 2010 28 9']